MRCLDNPPPWSVASAVIGRVSNRIISSLTETRWQWRPFAPQALPRFKATMASSDFHLCPLLVMDSEQALRLFPSHKWGSQVPDYAVSARRLFPPRKALRQLLLVSLPQAAGFSSPRRLAALQFLLTRPQSDSLALRLARSLSGASAHRVAPRTAHIANR